nr:putative aminotransferase [Quercus suber]
MAPSATLITSVGDHARLQGDGSLDHEKRQHSNVMYRSLHHDPPMVLSAQGNHLHLAQGRQILDATGGAAVACLGHGNKRVQDAIYEQAGQICYCPSAFYTTSPAEELSKLLVESTNGEMKRVFLVNSGSEAVEAALKLARQFHLEKIPNEPSRTHFISRHQSYHGTTLGALSVSGHVGRRAIFEPILNVNSSHVSPCFAYRGQDAGESASEYVRRLEAELDAEFRHVGPSKVAAFIAEPVVGATLGCVPAVKGYFKAVKRVCDRYGALLIFDEVMCGSGRIGPEPTVAYPKPLHAWQDPLIGVTPDIMTLGKCLGGGFQPVAAALVGERVVSALELGSGAFSHGHTYQAMPVACRAALEVQRIIASEDLIANVRRQGALLGKLLQQKLASHPAVGDIRGRGLFWGLEFVANKTTKEPFDPADTVAQHIHELGKCAHDILLLQTGLFLC